MMFPDAPKINKTLDYDAFRALEFNRAIDKNNLKKIIAETKKKFQLHRFPILVNENFEIIDGQHRFEASKILKAPVYYIMDSKLGDDFNAVHSVNKAGKKHSFKDKLEMLNKSGDNGAKTIYSEYVRFNYRFSLSIVAQVLMDGMDRGRINEIDGSAKIRLSNIDKGIDVLNSIVASENIPNRFTHRIVFAVSLLCKKNKISPSLLCSRVSKNICKWIEPSSRDDACLSMVKCYNFNLPLTSRIIK